MYTLASLLSVSYFPGWTAVYLPFLPALSIMMPFTLWKSVKLNITHLIGIIFLIYAIASILWSNNFDDAVYGLWYLCILALIFRLGTGLTNLKSIYAGLTVGMTISSLIGIAQYFDFNPVFTAGGSTGLLFNTTIQGEVLALLIVGLASEKMYYHIPLLLPGLMLSNSRGAFLALIVGMLSIYIRKWWLLALLLIPAGAFFYKLVPSDVQRTDLWMIILDNLNTLGHGVGSFKSIVYQDPRNPDPAGIIYPWYAHNDLLQVMFEYGIAVLFPIAIFSIAYSQTNSKEWPVLFTFIIIGTFSFPLYSPILAFMGLLASGRCISDWDLVRSKRDSRRLTFLSWASKTKFSHA